jgi:hypothetical protein
MMTTCKASVGTEPAVAAVVKVLGSFLQCKFTLFPDAVYTCSPCSTLVTEDNNDASGCVRLAHFCRLATRVTLHQVRAIGLL